MYNVLYGNCWCQVEWKNRSFVSRAVWHCSNRCFQCSYDSEKKNAPDDRRMQPRDDRHTAQNPHIFWIGERNARCVVNNTIWKTDDANCFHFCQNQKVSYLSNCQHQTKTAVCADQHQLAWELIKVGASVRMDGCVDVSHHTPVTTHLNSIATVERIALTSSHGKCQSLFCIWWMESTDYRRVNLSICYKLINACNINSSAILPPEYAQHSLWLFILLFPAIKLSTIQFNRRCTTLW